MRYGALAAVALFLAAPVVGIPHQPAPTRLDVLYIGAHPDDEAYSLATFGQLNADHKLRVGVVTITRGEGGGSAVGNQEGPALGQIREAEERRAVAKAGIHDVVNLDKPDFYYTVSSPLTEQVWGKDDTLAKVVRVIRETQPKAVFTMDPAPTPGNHGNHQFAARLAIEAFQAAADPNAYPDQLSQEGLHPWSVSRLFIDGLQGQRTLGGACVSDFTPAEPTDRVWGVWSGKPAPGGGTWAEVERDAQRQYASQGWTNFPDVPTDTSKLGCEYFTQVAGRVAYDVNTRGADGLLPSDLSLYATPSQYEVTPGSTVDVNVTASPGPLTLPAPPGWTVSQHDRTFTVTVPADAKPGKVLLPVTLGRGEHSGTTGALIDVVAPVTAEPPLLPQLAEFRAWARQAGHPELGDRVPAVQSMPLGGSRGLDVTVQNHGQAPSSGSVELKPSAGFSADGPQRFANLAPGASTVVHFTVRDTDSSLKTGTQGGDHPYTVDVHPDGGPSSSTQAALELVPTTAVPEATVTPNVDGVAEPGEYPGPALDVSALWEGQECKSAQDCSAKAQLSWRDDTLYALVTVTDNVLGTKLDAATDCKRHWRTDSVELDVDPQGNSENTSTTFKLGALPVTEGGPPCTLRDADNHQGAAPGVRIASKVGSPYHGYSIEVAVPMSQLPAAVDPHHMGLNVLVYDSDSHDKTGKSRIGWSTWGGVQGDPYRWGQASLPGYTPPSGRPATAPQPVLPLAVLASVDSPQSIDQDAHTGLPLGGAPAAKPIWVGPGFLASEEAGAAHVFYVDDKGNVLDHQVIEVSPGLTQLPKTDGRILVGFVDTHGATAAATSG